MKGTDKQKALARYELGMRDWSEKELKEAADGFTLSENEIAEFRGESESKPVSDTGESLS